MVAKNVDPWRYHLHIDTRLVHPTQPTIKVHESARQGPRRRTVAELEASSLLPLGDKRGARHIRNPSLYDIDERWRNVVCVYIDRHVVAFSVSGSPIERRICSRYRSSSLGISLSGTTSSTPCPGAGNTRTRSPMESASGIEFLLYSADPFTVTSSQV